MTIVGVGTCTVTASQAGNANYQPAADATRPFQVTPATTSTAARGEATYGDATATLTATVTRVSNGQPVPQGGAVTFTFNGAAYPATTNAQGVATATVPLPRGQGAGTFAGRVQASYAGNATYSPSSGSGTLIVARRVLWVKPVDRTVGLKQPNPPTTPPAGCAPTGCWLALSRGSTFAPGESWASLNLAGLRFQYSRNPPGTNATERVGSTYRITAFGLSSTNYDIRYDPGTLTVVAAP
ncbi:MAG: Ig-like domain repeat protein [Thermomicrobiales bacterium]